MKDKIKILYAVEAIGGGVLRHIVDLATNISSDFFDITIVIPEKKYNKEIDSIIDILNKKKIKIDLIDMSVKYFYIVALYKIFKYLYYNKFDIIHAHSSKAGFLFRITNVIQKRPSIIIYTPHCFFYHSCFGLKRIVYICIERILAIMTNVIVLSENEKENTINMKIAKSNKIVVINNAINNVIKVDQSCHFLRRKLKIIDEDFIVLGVGRLVHQKNWDLFIESAKYVLSKNQNYTFIIVGDGPLYKKILEKIDAHNLSLKIKVVGYVHNVEQFYLISNLFLSTSKYEGLPYTYLDAFRYGLKLIIPPVQGFDFFVEKMNCICIQMNDYKIIGDKILSSCSKMNRREYPVISEELSMRNFISNHQSLYIHLLIKSKLLV